MSLEIVRRSIGNVTILDCTGKNTLGEGASNFGGAIRDLVHSGRKKIILNFSGVTHQDSTGGGELVGCLMLVTHHGGSVVMLNPSKELKGQLWIMNLFDIFEDEVSAFRYLEISPLHCVCPICGAHSSPALLEESPWPPQTCSGSNCGAQFTLILSASNPAADLIESVRMATYADEYLEIVISRPFKILIVGRLNLFTSSALSRLWRALPARIVLFDLRRVTEVSPEGRNALLGLIRQVGKDEGAAISLEGLGPEGAQRFPSVAPAYRDNATALAALADLVPKTPSWSARFE